MIPAVDSAFRLDEKTHRIVLLSLAAVTGMLGAWVMWLLLAGPGAGTTVFQNAANLFIIATIVTFVFRGYRPAAAKDVESTEPGWEYSMEPSVAQAAEPASLSQRIAGQPTHVEAAVIVPDLSPMLGRRSKTAGAAPAATVDVGGSLQDRLEQHLAERESANRALAVADLSETERLDSAEDDAVDPAAELTAWARAGAAYERESREVAASEPSAESRPQTHVEPVRSTQVRRMDVHAGDAAAHRPVEKVEYDEDEETTPGDDAVAGRPPEAGRRPSEWKSSSTPYIH